MAETARHEVDGEQVKKATKALLAYQKTKKRSNVLLLNEHDRISILLTVWRIPSQAQAIKIPLPHGIRPDTCDVCLFTKDEPNMSVEQTEKFYKKILCQHGVRQITEIIPLKKMKKEYKQFEAKRRLLSSFDLFLADARIRRLLPSHIGKHFYKEKREPLSVNLKSKNLATELNRYIQGTQLHITNKGCCYAICVAHTGMKVEDIVENILAVAQVLAVKLPMKWKNVKVLHLKTQSSVALPIYNSSFDSLKELDLVKIKKVKKQRKRSAKKGKPTSSKETGDQLADGKSDTAAPHKEQSAADDAEEEIPQLVPIQEPNSAKKSKKKKTDFLEESKVEEKSKGSVENMQASSTIKSTLKKRKINETEVKTPSKQRKEMPSEEKSKKPEEKETPANRSIFKKTPSKHKKALLSDERSKETPPKGSILKKTPGKFKKDLPPEKESKETPPKRSVLKKTPSKHKKALLSDERSKETPPKVSILKKTPIKHKKALLSDERSKETPPKVLKKTLGKLKVLPPEKVSKETPPKRSVLKKTPSKHKKELPSEEESKEPEEQENPPKRSVITKTPKKAPSKSAVTRTSARKAPQTPNLKQRKKMKTPQSV